MTMQPLEWQTIRQRLAAPGIGRRLAGYRPSPGRDWRRAAVLVPLLQDQTGMWRLLFIRRAASQRDHHSGQVAFPGGRCEADDADVVATALREAWEEVALEPGGVIVVGSLQELATSSGYRVTPVVGRIPWPHPLHPHRGEVARCFTIPLAWLANPRNHRVREVSRGLEVVYFEPYQGEVLWGVTGAMVLDLLARIEP